MKLLGGGPSRALPFAVAFFCFDQPTETKATEGGGSNYPLGVMSVYPGVAPEVGFTFTLQSSVAANNRLNDSRGNRAIQRFHVDAQFASGFFTYGWAPPIEGVRFASIVVPQFGRAAITTQAGNQGFHAEKKGFGDTYLIPLIAGIEGDAGFLGHWNQKIQLTALVPTAHYSEHDRLNLGRNYISYGATWGVSLFPKPGYTIGWASSYIYNYRNHATGYLSGQEFDVDFTAGVMLTRNWSVDLVGYYYTQLTPDRRSGTIVGDGNFGHAIGFGPQVRYQFHPGALTLKWFHEAEVYNRAAGNKVVISGYVPF